MEMKVNYLILKDSVIINFDSKTFTVNRDTDEFEIVLDHIKNDTLQEIPAVVDVQKVIAEYVPDGTFVIHKGCVYADGVVVSGYIGEKLLEFAEESLPYKPLLELWRRIKDNPSENSKSQLYRFLESCKIPITDEGKFIAYKSVRTNMTDHHTGNFKYELNKEASMDRDFVVDDASYACGPGLHVGSYRYAESFGGSSSLILEMEVDPADVVSVPTDHSSQKLRACRITPIAVCQREYKEAVVITNSEPEEVNVDPACTVIAGEGTVLIGRNNYCASLLDADTEVNMSEFYSVAQLRPSKAAKNIKAFDEGSLVACTRFTSEDNVCYLADYGEKRALFVPEGYVLVLGTPAVVEETAIDPFMNILTVSGRNYECRVHSLEYFISCVDTKRSLSRSKYPVALKRLNAETGDIIDNVLRGVIEDTGEVQYLVTIGDVSIHYSVIE